MTITHRAGGIPYWSISGFYFFYFGILGTLVPYWNLYLKKAGFSPLEIGLLTGGTLVARVAAPYLAGWLADRTGRTMAVIRSACAFTALTFSGMFLSDSLWWIAGVTFFYNFFWSCCLSQFEANTLAHLGDNTQRYGRIRIWGSIGFIVLVIGVGRVLEQDLFLLLPILLILMLTNFLVSLAVPQAQRNSSITGKKVGMPNPAFLGVGRRMGVFFLICALMQASHGPYYTFFSIYLEDRGYSRSLVGELWAVGVLAEILIFMVMPALLRRFGVRSLVYFSLCAAIARWLLIGMLVDKVLVVLLTQVLHAATFAIFHGCSMELVNAAFPAHFRGRGQALYSSLGFGVGGALGGLAAGLLWGWAGPLLTFGLSSGVAGLALILATRLSFDEIPSAKQQQS